MPEFGVGRFHDLFLITTELSNRSTVVEASQMPQIPQTRSLWAFIRALLIS